MKSRRTWAALACIALSACVYEFDNPVAAAPSGSLAGRLVLQGAAAGQSLDGGIIKLAWSGLTIALDSSGQFEFLDLPDGTYTLVYQVPPVVLGDPPFVGVLRDVVVPAVSGGADSVDLGSIAVAAAGKVVGTVLGARDPVVVAFFATVDGGGQVFEGFSTTTADGGQYEITLPVGQHTLVTSSSTLTAETTVTVGSLQTFQVPTLVLQLPVQDGGAGVAGNMIFGGPGLGASASPDVVTTLTQTLAASDFPPLGGSVALQQQIQQVGLPFAQPVRPGRPYDFVCSLPGTQDAGDEAAFDALSIKNLPVLADRPTNLGPVPWLPRAVFDANLGERPPPSWSGIAGAPSLAGATGIPFDAGPANAEAEASPIVTLIVLPVGTGSHALVWATAGGAVLATNDVGGTIFGFPNELALGGSTAPATLCGASDGDGGLVVAWNLVDGGVQVATDYLTLGGGTIFDAGQAVAVATGGSVLFTTADDASLQLLSGPQLTPRTLAAPSGTFAAVTGLVTTPCQTDVPDGLCFVWTDAAGMHGALADPATGQVTVGGLIAADAQGGAIAALVDSISGAPYVAAAWIDSANGLNWAYMGSMIDSTQWAQQAVGVQAAGPALLLPWQGVPLAVYESGPDLTMTTTTLPSGVVPSPVFPGDAGASLNPGGYADSNGTLNVALISDGGPTLFQLTP